MYKVPEMSDFVTVRSILRKKRGVSGMHLGLDTIAAFRKLTDTHLPDIPKHFHENHSRTFPVVLLLVFPSLQFGQEQGVGAKFDSGCQPMHFLEASTGVPPKDLIILNAMSPVSLLVVAFSGSFSFLRDA